MIGRRKLLLGGVGGLGAATLTLVPRPLLADEPALQSVLNGIRGGRLIQPGRVALELPALADNGNSVGLKVSIDPDAESTNQNPATDLWILSPRNPEAVIAHFRFGPLADTSAIETRIRLSGSQEVLAVARLADDSLWSAGAEVLVSVSACIDGLL